MITFNVFDRVFFVRGLVYGTAFTIDVDQRQYLVSARHVLGGQAEISSLNIFFRNTWMPVPVEFVGSGRGEVDITILSPKVRMSPAHPLD